MWLQTGYTPHMYTSTKKRKEKIYLTLETLFCSHNILLKKTQIKTKTDIIDNNMKAKGILFGLNYSQDPDCALSGCVNDVVNMARYLVDVVKMPCDVYTDPAHAGALTRSGMVKILKDAASATYKERLDLLYIHYSGHGTCIPDTSADEADFSDECLVPLDFRTSGYIVDDVMQKIFQSFNPKTKVVCVFDCCHSGTLLDVRYSWPMKSQSTMYPIVENTRCRIAAPVLTISGCMDHQTSAESYTNGQVQGAMTSVLLEVLQAHPQARSNVYLIVSKMRKLLSSRGYSQEPKVCSNYNITFQPSFV